MHVFFWSGNAMWECIKNLHFVIHGCKNCHWLINLMFYTLENGTKMFADHENLGINFLILKIYWVFMEIWGKYHFPIMAPTKWPPFWPEGEIDVAPYPKTLTMTKGMSVPSFMLVPQNARFFHISLGLCREGLCRHTGHATPMYSTGRLQYLCRNEYNNLHVIKSMKYCSHYSWTSCSLILCKYSF